MSSSPAERRPRLALAPPPAAQVARDDDAEFFSELLENTDWDAEVEHVLDAFRICCGSYPRGPQARALEIVEWLADDVQTLQYYVGRRALAARQRIDRTFAALRGRKVEKDKERAMIVAVSFDAYRWQHPNFRSGALAGLNQFVGSLWPEVAERVTEATFVAASKAWFSSPKKPDGRPSSRAGPRRWPRLLDLLEEAGLSPDTARISDPVRRSRARARKIKALKAFWGRIRRR